MNLPPRPPSHGAGTPGSVGLYGGPAKVRAIVLSLVACGCAGGTSVYSIPTDPTGPTALLAHQIDVRALYEARLDPVRASPPELRLDEILVSPVFGDPDFAAALLEWVDYWSVDASPWMSDYLSGLGTFGATIDSALAANEMPPSLRYLPFIESGYNPRASSHANAVGLWQFMEGTAEEMGMEVSRLLDERRDPVRSTEAAIVFLVELKESFGSWFMALAAYNAGPTRTRRILRERAPDAEPSDSLFWALRRYFPRETQGFIPKLVAAGLVAAKPEEYGLEAPAPSERFAYDRVRVPDATTLDVVAFAAGVPLEAIEGLNPQLVRGMTPPGRESDLRVPRGRGTTFERTYAAIPAEERVTFVEHRIEAGETLSHIATRYGVLVADLRAANPGVRPRYLRIGSRLTVPVAPSARETVSAGS